MESLCGSQLLEWSNDNTTSASVKDNHHHQHHVDFSTCFHMTILRWSPCAILWVVAPCWFYMLRKPATYKVKTSWLLLCKTLAILGLISVEAFNFARAAELTRAPVYYVTPTITIFTYILALSTIHLEKIKGLPSSTLLFVFWAFFVLFMSITLRKVIIEYWIEKVSALPDLISFLVFYSLLVVNLVLSVLSEKSTRVYDKSKESSMMDDEELLIDGKSKLKPMPENQAPLLSRLSFWWINDLIIKGFKKPLTREDLWQVDEQEASQQLTEKLETTWASLSKDYFEAFKARPDLFSVSSDGAGKSNKKRKIFRSKEPVNHEEQVELTQQPDVVVRTPKKMKKPSLTVCLIKTFGGKFLAGAFIKVIQDCLLFVGPLILDRLITFVKKSNEDGGSSDPSVGFFYTGLLFITALIQSFALQHYFHRMFIVGARVRTSTMNLIYKKSIKLSTSARRTATVGEMTNLMSVNAQMLADLTTYLNVVWSSPFQIIISLVLLYQYLGVSALLGVGTVLILIPLNIYVSNRIKAVQLTKQKQQDARIKMMNEILSGIKVLKFYGWELSFKDIVGQIRSTEMKYYKKIGLLSILANFLWMCAPLIITIVSFGCFLFLNDNSKFTANVVFVSLSLFNILRFPLIVLPGIISAIISAQVSLKRISSFLLKEEIDENDITRDQIQGVAVRVENADLGWSHDETFIKGLDLEVKKGKLVAIVGPVGSGKSSLVSGLLGEMHKLNDGLININGQTAYVPQQAWIQNQTLKNNILFRLNRRVDEERYKRVIEACSLTTDLLIMPAGDKTEIGEKGINLSGGQKQRISLARAVYSDADIYMLDDPLSAVDSHVGKHIFDHVIGPNGMLRDKTRILVTNALSFLPQCDEIILLDNGRILEIGSYDRLVSKKDGRFNYFIKSYLENENKTDDEELEDQELPPVTTDILPSTSSAVTTTTTPNNQSIRRKSRASPELTAVKETKKVDEKAGEKIIQKEKIETGKIKLSILMAYFRACRLHLFGIFVFLFSMANIASVGSNWWLSAWTDSSKQNLDSSFHKAIDEMSKRFSTSYPALLPFLIFCAIGFLQCALTFISDMLFLFMSVYAANRLHDSMLFSILRSTLQFFESTPSGRIINRFSKDIDAAERSIPEAFKSLMRCIYQVMFTVMVITFSTPWFLVAFVPIVIVYFLIQRYFVASMRQLKRLDSASKSPIFSHFSETLTGVTTIRAYKMERNFTRHMEYLVDENLLFYIPNNVSNRWLAIRLELIGNLIAVFAALFAVISRNTLSPSLVGLSISYALNVSQTLNWFVRMSAEFETNVTSVERIQEYCETPHEKEWYIESSKPEDKWPSQGRIVFNNYSVRYREELENVLKEISIKIEPGEKIGIVGRTGAGKSSLALGLFRLLELSEGTIEIDGVDIKELGLHHLRHKLTIIPQDPVIFSGTIRMNLDPFGSHSAEEIWRALELVDLKPFVNGLEKGLEYECSEGGENLSVGQRQLICLARALLRKSKILILDEATASIDHNTDELIQKTIRTQFDDCTVLTVAHRLNTILDSSRIMVLDKGTIAEFDSPQNLLKNKNSKFYSMAKDAGLV